MTNLLEETREAIERSGHTEGDVLFIGSSDGEYSISWERFLEVADVEYHSGFGASEVATDLTVVFKDGRKMWRGEYDGSEWWDFDMPNDVDYTKSGKRITRLVGGMWEQIAELNDEG
jgi:hypothetical protein